MNLQELFLFQVDLSQPGKKLKSHFKIRQMALAYLMRFNKKYDDILKKLKEQQQQFIKDDIELEEKNLM